MVLAALVAVVAMLLVRGPASTAQRRTDFTTMVRTINSDLAKCNANVSAAISGWQRVEHGSDSQPRAEKAAQRAAQSCAPSTANAIWQLSLYSVPSSLLGLRLNYAVSCLGVWAQEDVQPAMRAEQILLHGPGDRHAATTYRRLAGWAAGNLASANSTLRRAARRLGVGDFIPIHLTSLAAVGLTLRAR